MIIQKRYVLEKNSSSYLRRFAYEYDNAGNISQTSTSIGVEKVRYFYDKQNQLVLEVNTVTGKSYEYIYDGAGNIRQKKIYSSAAFTSYSNFTSTRASYLEDTINYEYTNSNNLDLLTSYDGHALTYDAIGNPTNYYGIKGYYNILWTNGRELNSLAADDFEAEYYYNADGLRISKWVEDYNDINLCRDIKYYYSGGKLISESWGNKSIEFLYDESGIYGIFYNNGTTETVYYFIKNLQGDVVEIVDQLMNRVATYTYDAWGNVIAVKDANSNLITDYSHIAQLNPIRYRGYYYDTETGFYYLGSRYYDPAVGRFINADNVDVILASLNTTTDKNLYTYCDNNPVMRVDAGGAFWDTVFDVISLAASIVEVAANPTDVSAWVGLVGDVIDVAVPCVAGVGEVVKSVTTARKVKKGIETAGETADVVKTGWKVGDNIENLTKAGKDPSWSTVRQRYWKNEEYYHGNKYSSANRKRMASGRAPTVEYNGKSYSMELHHKTPRRYGGKNSYNNLEKLTPWEHARKDKYRHFKP